MKGLINALGASKKPGWRIFRLSLALYMGAVMLAVLFEPRFIYFPTRLPPGTEMFRSPPVREGRIATKIEDCRLVAEDGARLHGWFCSPLQRKGRFLTPVPTSTVVLFLHGNGGNVNDRRDMIQKLVAFPVSVFALDYRGYGDSEGSPSEAGLYRDARAAWRYLTAERGIPAHHIVIFGESLGGAIAIDLAARSTPAGLIVQSSFTSMRELAGLKMPFVPRFLVRTRMDSIRKIGHVSCPKLFLHGTADAVVPFSMGRRLLAAAREPKQFYAIAGAGHNDVPLVGGSGYYEALRRFIAAATNVTGAVLECARCSRPA